jgi:hypothetical protein
LSTPLLKKVIFLHKNTVKFRNNAILIIKICLIKKIQTYN